MDAPDSQATLLRIENFKLIRYRAADRSRRSLRAIQTLSRMGPVPACGRDQCSGLGKGEDARSAGAKVTFGAGEKWRRPATSSLDKRRHKRSHPGRVRRLLRADSGAILRSYGGIAEENFHLWYSAFWYVFCGFTVSSAALAFLRFHLLPSRLKNNAAESPRLAMGGLIVTGLVALVGLVTALAYMELLDIDDTDISNL